MSSLTTVWEYVLSLVCTIVVLWGGAIFGKQLINSLLNPLKPEFLLLGAPQQLKKLLKSLKLDYFHVELGHTVRNFGAIFLFQNVSRWLWKWYLHIECLLYATCFLLVSESQTCWNSTKTSELWLKPAIDWRPIT